MADRQTISRADVGNLTATKRAHEVFKIDKPQAVRINEADGTPRNIAIGDTEALDAHGVVSCPDCGAPNHAQQLSDAEQPWIMCGCTGLRKEVQVSKPGREYLKAHREAMVTAVNEGRGVVGRG